MAASSAAPAESRPHALIGSTRRLLTARPDSVDFRDRMYGPTLVEVPPVRPIEDYQALALPILDQGSEGACTGFGLAAVAHHQLATRRIGADRLPVSPWMFYALARRYDEWAGEDYEGSSCRGAMKGWHKHGICAGKLWTVSSRTRGALNDKVVADASRRPLGSYFRVNHQDFVAMHAAITEVGILYASAQVHAGWQQVGDSGLIELRQQRLGGHAFAIVAYDERGFWIQNSWGASWGRSGYGHVSYADWLANGTDVWVARLGVPVSMDSNGAGAAGPRAGGVGTVRRRSYQYNEIRPHVISIRNDGQLDPHGNIGTTPESVREIIHTDFVRRTSAWQKRRLVLYAHGGLVSQDSALQRLADYRHQMLPREIYPIAFIWKSDYWTTLRNMLEDATRHRRPEGILDDTKDFMLDRLDDALEPLARRLTGKAQWDEMKENALRATTTPRGGARCLADQIVALAASEPQLELHLVGHSAGSILLAPLLSYLLAKGVRPSTCTLWAPACTVSLFREHYLPAIEAQALAELALFSLTDQAEQDDDCARIYNKSLLYLVSNALEKTVRIPMLRPDGEPILGMEKFLEADPTLAALFDPSPSPPAEATALSWIRSPNAEPVGSLRGARASSHGAFDDDPAVVAATIGRILAAGAAGLPAAARAGAGAVLPVAPRFGSTAASRSEHRRVISSF
ncbi:MAG: C1 family peptidase [Cyanobium sp.]